MRLKFAHYWQWAQVHLQRNRADAQVFDLDYLKRLSFESLNVTYQQWIQLPDYYQDHLFHWRFIQDIEGVAPGVVLQTADESVNYPPEVPSADRIWQDGAQVASDADLLIAYSLWMAWKRGWGDEYEAALRSMLADIKGKVVLDFCAGELVNTEAVRPKVSIGTWSNGVMNVVSMQPELMVSGNNFYADFWQNEGSVLDFTDLAELAIEARSGLGYRLKLQDANGVSVFSDQSASTAYQTNRFAIGAFHSEITTNFDWATVTDIIIQYPNDRTADSYVAVRRISATLTQGQTHAHDGLVVTSNAHGDLAINPSYFIFPALRAFAQYDDRAYWEAVIDRCYSLIDAGRNLTLHDKEGNEVVPKGSLIPNWFQLNPLTGEYEDVYFQKSNNTICGYQHSYDAFRTLFWLACDYRQAQDMRAYSLLNQMGLFYRNELESGIIWPSYRLDGQSADTDYIDEPLGFALVHADLFALLGQEAEAEQLACHYFEQTRLADESARYSVSEDPAYAGGESEYFLNYWTFFAAVQHRLTTAESGFDFDADGKTDFEEVLLGSDYADETGRPPIQFSEIDDIMRIEWPMLPNRKYVLHLYDEDQKQFFPYQTLNSATNTLGDPVSPFQATVPLPETDHAMLYYTVEML